MKPIRNTIPIRELQTLIRQWRHKGLKETALLKVLELYLGLPEYMNAAGEYPSHFFYELSKSLKFHTVTLMLESMKRTESFGWKEGDNKLNVSSFCSPLWKEDAKMHVLPANLQEGSNITINNNINIPLSRGEDPSEEGKRFFHEIKMNPNEKAEYLEPLICHFQQQEAGVPREEACADVGYLVNELLIPHFSKQEKFLKMKHNGRLAWLRNLLKSAHGKELIRKAAEAGRQRRCLMKQQALAEIKEKNRPLSPFEWTDPESGTRFYEDDAEGRVTIPADAPPRPSEEAFWNVFKKSWTT